MPLLHLFYPQNDLALARDIEHFTAPPAAQRLSRSGQTLPLWYGDNGDKLIEDGINGRWYSKMISTFGIGVEPFNRWDDKITAAPWGWSKSSRHFLSQRGIPMSAMPTDEQLQHIRDLSHRRTAARIGELLANELSFEISPAAKELFCFEDIEKYVSVTGNCMLKLPWSSSGRGVIPVDSRDLIARRQSIEGALARQGSIMAEPRFNKKLDFALLYSMNNGKCSFCGFSVFNTQGNGAYTGNILASDSVLKGIINKDLPNGQLDAILATLPSILERIIDTKYNGALGIDMLVCDNSKFALAPSIEMNLRMTMGHLCRRFFDNYITTETIGNFTIMDSANYLGDDYIATNKKLQHGRLNLAQPGSDFAFEVNLK